MSVSFALVSDFDGTISKNDFFFYLIDHYFDENALAPWRQYLAGTKKHFDALNEMYGSLRISEDELKQFISGIEIDKSFFDLADYCLKHNIPTYICSAGCDYYINVLIKKEIKQYHIELVTNRGTYSPQTGLTMTPNTAYYDEKLGTSKTDLVSELKHKGHHVIYCGDGLPDVGPARISDTVFARKTLYQECQKDNIPALFLNTFDDVKQFIKEHQK